VSEGKHGRRERKSLDWHRLSRALRYRIQPKRDLVIRALLCFRYPLRPDARGSKYIFEKWLRALSQKRWAGSEPDPELTWGEVFTGDSFIDAVQTRYSFCPDHNICEIGPGYGRLLQTILQRELPFQSYTGIELSQERVRKLNTEFNDARVRFIQGDVAELHSTLSWDLVICSSTFEHLFPDFTKALSRLADHLTAHAVIAIDFPQMDREMKSRSQAFELPTHAFVRIYSAEEIERLFAACGLANVQMQSIFLGKAPCGDVRRIFVSAIPAR
jgi:phospholipid N-methyltransferase